MVRKFREGRNGWFFLDNDTNNVFDQISGDYSGAEEVASRWVNLNDQRQRKASEISCNLYTYVVPNKHCVYREFLPEDVSLSSDRLVKKILAAKPKKFEYDVGCYSGAMDTFHKTDTHWNDYGAYLLFRRIAKDYGFNENLDLSDDDFFERDMKGDLNVGTQFERGVFSYISADDKLVFCNGVQHVGRISIWENAEADCDKEFICFGGSSVNQIAKYFAASVKRFVYVWTQSIDWELVHRLGIKNVISMPRERFLVQVPTDDMRFEHCVHAALKFLSGNLFDVDSVVKNGAYQHLFLSKDRAYSRLANVFKNSERSLSRRLLSNRIFKSLSIADVQELICRVSDDDSDNSELGFLYSYWLTLMVDKGLVPHSFFPVLEKLIDVDRIRDSAISLENEFPEKAHYLMNLAHVIRPQGPLIKSKLDHYEEKFGFVRLI